MYFRSLGWKLTFSYTLVTVAALLIIEAALLLIAAIIVQNQAFLPRMAASVMLPNTKKSAPFLQATPPDLAGLEEWLQDMAQNGFPLIPTNEQSSSRLVLNMLTTGSNNNLFVVDQHSQWLASAPPNKHSVIQPAQQAFINAALQGKTAPRQLVYTDDQRQMLIATPIFAPDNTVLGALVYTGTLAQIRNSRIPEIFGVLGISALFLTLTAGIIGSIFGLLTSRGLVRRLQAIASAADAWSTGNFASVIADRSQDELGRLALRLNQMSEQLQAQLEARRELASLEERNRLARDLHDSVKQQVFATAMQIGAARATLPANQAAAMTHIQEAERLVQQAQQELTVLIHELRPAALEGRGLVAALRELLAGWSQQTQIAHDLRVQGERPLPLATELALYRIVQEALSNISRHSGASQVAIHLVWHDQQVELTITDNGHGFSTAVSETEGVGLHSIHERVEALGGTLTIASSRNGVQLIIICPE